MSAVLRMALALALSFSALMSAAPPARAQDPPPAAPSEEQLEAPEDDPSAQDAEEDRVPRLIGEAEAVAAGGMASAAEVQELSRLMRELKEALETKAALLQAGEPTDEADASLETAASALEASSSGIAERAALAPEDAEEYPLAEGAASRPKESGLSAFANVLEDAAGVLERIKDLRIARSDAEDEEAADVTPNGEEPEPVELAEAEVSGSVTEDGQPIAGATVSDPESGASATTDDDGFFHLAGVPAGRLATLTASKAGRPLGVQRVLLTGGRSALADFGGAASAPSTPRAARLRPSIMRVRSAAGGSAGRISGEIRDARGRPGSGAAVTLERLGVVRSDVRGRFAFLGVPAGVHRIAVRLRGHQPRREPVRVAARVRADVRVQMRATPRAAATRVAWRGPGAASQVSGVIVDPDGHPVIGARIRLVRGSRALSVVSQARGRYAIRKVDGGTYHLLVSKAGFETNAQELVLRARESRTLNLRLARRPGAPAAALSRPPHRRPTGALHGRVVHGRTGRPVAGARLRLAGQVVVADATGAFRLRRLATGPQRLVVQASGFVDSERVVVVQAARDVLLTLALTPLRASPARPDRRRR